ncbi:MAG: HK97 gp10 family phage protein [Planctomycetota bacterium]
MSTIRLVGDRELRRMLRRTPPQVLDRAISPAVRRAMAPISGSAKKLITRHQFRDSSGLLRKSIGVRAKRYRRNGVAWVGVGPRTGFRQTVTTKTGRVLLRDPTKYAHLIEQGFTHRSGRLVPARPFLEPAMRAHLPGLERQLVSELGTQIPKIAARLAAKRR